MIVLAGDVGGTNTRLQLTECNNKKSKVLFAKNIWPLILKVYLPLLRSFLLNLKLLKFRVSEYFLLCGDF